MYLGYQQDKIKFYTEAPLDMALYNLDFIEETEEEYVLDGEEYVLNDDEYKRRQAEKERERLDRLTLTPADVERALYKAKSMDFEDLKALIAEKIPTIDLKALAIEFRAKDFYRGAEAGGMRLFDVVGQLLGYSTDDMDYLFKNKELPDNENTTDN
jgi:hypothetical protein